MHNLGSSTEWYVRVSTANNASSMRFFIRVIRFQMWLFLVAWKCHNLARSDVCWRLRTSLLLFQDPVLSLRNYRFTKSCACCNPNESGKHCSWQEICLFSFEITGAMCCATCVCSWGFGSFSNRKNLRNTCFSGEKENLILRSESHSDWCRELWNNFLIVLHEIRSIQMRFYCRSGLLFTSFFLLQQHTLFQIDIFLVKTNLEEKQKKGFCRRKWSVIDSTIYQVRCSKGIEGGWKYEACNRVRVVITRSFLQYCTQRGCRDPQCGSLDSYQAEMLCRSAVDDICDQWYAAGRCRCVCTPANQCAVSGRRGTVLCSRSPGVEITVSTWSNWVREYAVCLPLFAFPKSRLYLSARLHLA